MSISGLCVKYFFVVGLVFSVCVLGVVGVSVWCLVLCLCGFGVCFYVV